ncbi:hypothetical protein HMPREF1985_00699 [Mitsuokella sp. oral taxon 131 str. W9106]|nr:hypothetical protein HMPREF1985_00699 [Mitsuokella sp. oral taxon 131 str. W9106]
MSTVLCTGFWGKSPTETSDTKILVDNVIFLRWINAGIWG